MRFSKYFTQITRGRKDSDRTVPKVSDNWFVAPSVGFTSGYTKNKLWFKKVRVSFNLNANKTIEKIIKENQ